MNMKKINVIYRLLLLLCTVNIAYVAGAQVTGNQYKLFDTESGLNGSIADITAKYEDGNEASGIYNNNELEIKNAFDGKGGNWWSSSKSANVNIDIKFTEAKDFAGFNIYRSGTNADLESGIEVYTSEDGETWSTAPIATFAGYEVRSFNAFLPNTVNTQYLRLKLIYTGTAKVSVDEITLYGSLNNNNYGEIKHKRAKWFDLRSTLSEAAKDMDTFSDDTEWYQLNGKNIQAAHTYIDTIYAHKGTTVELSLPERHTPTDTEQGNISINSYQRWYSFRTDATFRTVKTGENEVWDLLTTASKDTPYRFENGYVGRPMTTDNVMDMNFYVPTDDEFKAWFPGSTVDNNYYIVACDVSAYTDYTETFNDNSKESTFYQSGSPTYEPTLVHRVLFYIVCVDGRTGSGSTGGPAGSWDEGFGRLKQTAYQGGYGEGKKFLEERTINMSAKRVSNNTQELVALSKDARSFAIPDAAPDDDSESVNISLVENENTAGIILINTNNAAVQQFSLTGVTRTIRFKAKNANADGTWSVPDNSHAVICVTKTVDNVTYNLARYNLVFRNEQQLLTETQLTQIADGSIVNTELLNYAYRTKNHFDENYELLTELNFDYDPSVAELYGKDIYYPFPLEWGSSSYAFYDGATGNDFKNAKKYPEWGYYAIQNGPVEWDTPKDGNTPCELLEGSTYHLYIDASDRPGLIARLPFEDKLCRGSELFVTAWVNSAKGDADDASMLLTIMGVKKGAAVGGQDSYTPIYTYSTGQIPKPSRLSGTIPGTGPGQNDWYQVYFSFINENDVEYDSYVLQIENNSYSTNGGDIYLDNVRVYVATPRATVSQLDASCANERTMMSIKLNWERLLSRIGATEGTDGVAAIDFCFIDKTKYDEYLATNATDYKGAIEASAVEVGNNDPNDEHFYSQKYNTLYFNLNFESNTNYDEKPHPRLAKDNYVGDEGSRKYYFYRTYDDGEKALVVDFFADLVANRPYLMLIQINDGDAASAQSFSEDINNECGINTSFMVTAQNIIRLNGEVVDPTTDYCEGQLFKFAVDLRLPIINGDGTESYIPVKDVYFDWFFGTEEEFLAENATYGDESLQSALKTFRAIYQGVVDLDTITAGTHKDQTGQDIELKQNQIDIIKHYIEADGPEGAKNKRLVLYRKDMDITLLSSGLQLVVVPIEILNSPDETIGTEQWALICWEYVPIELNVSNEAPQLRAGFNGLKYPSDDFNPGLRIGLDQIYSTNEKNTLRVDLRGAKLVSENAESIGMITSNSPGVYNKIYLIGSDDPAYQSYFNDNNFNQLSLPIGVLTDLYAVPYTSGSSFNDRMNIYFDTTTKNTNGFQFQPKEGYTYTFAVHFEEKLEEGAAGTACFGSFNVAMKVVPEYLVWSGTGATSNWNNDDNWKRADFTDLKNTDGTYITNEKNTTDNGFVPMLFTNVIMPKDSKAELYIAGYGDGGNGWVNSSRPGYMELPTENIQYDLMAYENTTQRYRVNICRDIHFEPGAQMLHAEQLIYNKAWTDVEITPRQWTAVSTPLQGVVAGDWYAPTATGRQETEYFKDITFNTTDYNRLNPAVYQRSWSTGATIVETGGGKTPVSFDTDWSSAYNDASVPYVAGGGFSIKGILNQGQQPSSTEKLLFRLPKADTSYGYDNDVSTGTLNRTKAGKLLISDMVDRSDPYSYVHSDVATATLTPSADGKYLMVGNPFMASLDVQAFVAANNGVLAQKYWYSDITPTTAVTYDAESETWSEGKYLAAPYSVFYVEAADPATAKDGVTVMFKADMQEIGAANLPATAPASLKITAEDAEGSSSAAVRYAASASNGFGMEDAQMINGLTGNADNAPKVYTVAGNTAVSVNQLKDAQRIPLGVTAADGSVVTLTFSGVAAVKDAALYDAKMQTETTLYEGYQLTLNGSSYGRYFLIGRGSGTTGITETGIEGNVSVSSIVPRQVVVTSDTELRSVSIWSAGGALLKKVTPNGSYTCTLNGVDSGMVIVRTDTAIGSQVTKIRVR